MITFESLALVLIEPVEYTHHCSGNGQSSDHVFEHGIVKKLHQAIAKPDVVSTDWEDCTIYGSFSSRKAILVLLVVLLVRIRLLELLSILSHLTFTRSINPQAMLGVMIAGNDQPCKLP